MKDSLLRMQTRLQIFLNDTNGQDLIEYVLIVALIAFAATVGMGTVASKINSAFSNIGTKLTTYVT
jgi:pilus assembly protein Flp/PilA